MSQELFVPNRMDSLVNKDGQPTQRFHQWMALVIEWSQPLTGSGTPEASVVANPNRWYVDTAVGAGSGIYFKETGTGDTGWVLRS